MSDIDDIPVCQVAAIADASACPAPVVQLFYNPASGSFRADRLLLLERALEAAGARVIRAISCDTADPLAIAPDASHVCIAGGDGTVRHVATLLARCGRALPTAIYPAGTVNLLASEGRYPAEPASFARRLLAGGAMRSHHPVAIGEQFFLACASAGPDSAAVAALSPRLKRRIGRIAYLVAFLGVLRRWPRPRITLAFDGREIGCEAFYVAKGRYFAGRWSFAPQASVCDGLLHVVALPRARRRDFARFAWALLRRRRAPGIHFTCVSLTARCADAVPVQADGDLVAALPVNLAIAERPLSFC